MIKIISGNQIKLFLILFAFVTNVSVALAQSNVEKSNVIESLDGKEYYIHTIEKGNTLYSISKIYGIPIEEIKYENPGLTTNLKLGQTIRIPVTSRDVEVAEEIRKDVYNFVYHVVREGETLTAIADVYDAKVDKIIKLNPGADRSIRAGEYIKIPVSARPEKSAKKGVSKLIEHRVEAGETLYSISKFYGVGIEEIKKYNPGTTDVLKTDMIIYIPYREPEEVEQIKDTLKHIKHTVKAKETLYSIALNYRVSIDSIRALNPGLVDEIYEGEVLKVPFPEMESDFIRHTVERRTRLKKIAEKYSMDKDALEDVNPGVGRRVRRGDILLIPLPDEMVELPEKYQEVTPGLKEIPEELLRLVDLDSVRCHQKKLYQDNLYHVALMLPLSLEYVDSLMMFDGPGMPEKYHQKPFNFIEFYEGFRLAADSLSKMGLKLKLYVYDVDDDLSKTIQVLQKRELKNMDLIIGPLYWRNFRMVSNFAEMYGINIVNPLSRRSEILEHANVFKLTPLDSNQLKIVENLIKKNFPESKVIIVKHNKYQNDQFLSDLRKNLEMSLDEKISVANSFINQIIEDYSKADTNLPQGTLLESLTVENLMLYRDYIQDNINDSITFQNRVEEVVFMEEGIDGLKSHASIIRPNVVVAYSDNKAFAFELLTRLNELKDTFDITLIGLPHWDRLTGLETDHMLNLNVHVLSHDHINYDDENVKHFIKKFRKRYYTEPGRFAYDGFDIGYYFLTALYRYGRDFENCLPYYNRNLIQTRFDFHFHPEKGFENTFWNIVNYRLYDRVLINER